MFVFWRLKVLTFLLTLFINETTHKDREILEKYAQKILQPGSWRLGVRSDLPLPDDILSLYFLTVKWSLSRLKID